MVSVAIMVVMLLAVGKIFKMSSDASGLVIAHTEVLERLETIARVIEADLRNIRPGLLIIDSRTIPPIGGTLVAQQATDIEDPTGTIRNLFFNAQPPVRFRSDGLTFISSGGPDLHQSHWSTIPITSNEAIISYGHSWPGNPSFATGLYGTAAMNWRLCRRAILMLDSSNNADWPSGNPPSPLNTTGQLDSFLSVGGLPLGIRHADVDAIAGLQVSALVPRIQTEVDNARAKPPSTNWNWVNSVYGLVGRSVLPATFDVNTYPRAGFLLAENVGDFIIEWTDGSGSPLNWYGQFRHIADLNGNDIPWEAGEFIGPKNTNVTKPSSIEDPTFMPPIYIAIWDSATWDRRPKALRITVRLYDGNQRLRESVGLVDGSGTPFTVTRYGQEHQVIIPIP